MKCLFSSIRIERVLLCNGLWTPNKMKTRKGRGAYLAKSSWQCDKDVIYLNILQIFVTKWLHFWGIISSSELSLSELRLFDLRELCVIANWLIRLISLPHLIVGWPFFLLFLLPSLPSSLASFGCFSFHGFGFDSLFCFLGGVLVAAYFYLLLHVSLQCNIVVLLFLFFGLIICLYYLVMHLNYIVA